MLNVRIPGGSNGGWKSMKEQIRKDWKCLGCAKMIRYFWTKCPNCGERRP